MTEQEKHQQLIESYEAHETNKTREPREVYVLMRFIGFMWLVSLGLISCSSEQLDEPVDAVRAIAFSAGVPEEEAVTRAATPLETEATTFRVWGIKNTAKSGSNYTSPSLVMDGYTVSWTANTAGTSTTNAYDWEYVNGTTQMIKYWDFAATAYRFFAYAPATASGVTVTHETSGGNESYDMTFAADASSAAGIAATPYFSELWFSNNDAVEYPDKLYGPVTLQFLKPFAYVRIIIKIGDGAIGLTHYDIHDIAFAPSDGTPIQQKGNVTIHYPLTGTGTEYTFSRTIPADPADCEELAAFETDWTESAPYVYTVLPVVTQGSYTLSLKVFREERTASVPAEYMAWKPGYHYTYVFKITEGGGVVFDLLEMAVRDWDETSRDYSVFNW